jgi:hypothetical protein
MSVSIPKPVLIGALVALLVLGACARTKPDAAFERITDLARVPSVVASAPAPALLVLDIDDTLLSTTKLGTTRAFFGSDRWYRWQKALPPGDAHKVPGDCLYDVIDIDADVVPLEAVQPDAAATIASIPADRLILTARSPAQRAGTERALAAAHYPEGKPLPTREGSAAPGAPAYAHGILMTKGAPKGPALVALLAASTGGYRSVVMVDDDSKNLESVRDALAGSGVVFEGLRYAGIKDEPVPPPTAGDIRGADEAWLAWRGWIANARPDEAARILGGHCGS